MKRFGMLRKSGVAISAALILATLLVLPGTGVNAQNTFTSGSTGADGAFAPTATESVPVPASGTFNFTTVNIPSGVTVTFTPNATNTPVTILATSDVTIAGSIVVSGQQGGSDGVGGLGGPGGFRGGNGGFGVAGQSGTNGDGPGGGGGATVSGSTAGIGAGAGYLVAGAAPTTAGSGQGGPAYGSATILPLIGGSGGGGAGSVSTINGGGGGGGGGAILIASSTMITISGSIHAAGAFGNGPNSGARGGSGSGGAIRLVANTLSGSGTLDVSGGQNTAAGNQGSPGYVRAEAFNLSVFTPNLQAAIPASLSTPNPVNLSGGPSLVIASVAGMAPPAVPNGSLTEAPDIVLPASQSNPVTVALQAANIPIGSSVLVTVVPTVGASTTVTSTALVGTTASSSATASVTLPAGVSVITATITINFSSLAANRPPAFINGERVEKVEIAATFGGGSQLTYITSTGKRIAAEGK